MKVNREALTERIAVMADGLAVRSDDRTLIVHVTDDGNVVIDGYALTPIEWACITMFVHGAQGRAK